MGRCCHNRIIVDGLRHFIANVTKPKELTIGTMRTDEGEEIEGNFTGVLMEHALRHEGTPL